MKKLILALVFFLIGNSLVNAQAQTVEPPYNMSEIAAYSIYLTSYQNDNYQKALKYGRWIVINMPKTIEGYPSFDLSTNLGRFVTIYSQLAKEAENPSAKAAYVDTVQTIFTKAFDRFSKEEFDLFSWKIREGRFYQDYAPAIGENAMEKAIAAYKKAFAINPQKMATSYEGYYLKVLLRELADKKTQQAQQKAIAIITKTEQYANEDLAEYFDQIRQQLFDKPQEQIAYLKSELEENPENIQALRKLRNLYTRQGKMQKAQQINQKLYKVNPSYQNIVSLAKFAIGHAEYQQAIKYYNEALSKTNDQNKVKTIYFKMADAELSLDNFAQAAEYARQAINTDSDWGRAYLKLATIFAQQVRACTQGRKLTREDRAVYWLVLDYVLQAKRVDSSVASRANTLLQTFRPAAPTQQDVFFVEEWEEGGTITIDASLGQCYGWINETTTVRVVN